MDCERADELTVGLHHHHVVTIESATVDVISFRNVLSNLNRVLTFGADTIDQLLWSIQIHTSSLFNITVEKTVATRRPMPCRAQ